MPEKRRAPGEKSYHSEDGGYPLMDETQLTNQWGGKKSHHETDNCCMKTTEDDTNLDN